MDQPSTPALATETRCLECECTVRPGDDCEVTHKGVFCRACFSRLAAQLSAIVRQSSQNINYVAALVGALAGASVGTAIWWGFTILTHIQFGLVAVVIGIAVAKGVLLATGGRRSPALPYMGVAVSAVAFFYANYLVTRTFLIQAYPQVGEMLAIVPHPAVLLEVTMDSFNLFMAIFLAIVLWQTWTVLKPKT